MKIALTIALMTILIQSSFARGYSDIRILDCQGASITIGHDYQYTGSTFQTLRMNQKVIRYLLSLNSNEVVNRAFLLGPNSMYHISPSIDLNHDLDLAKSIVELNGVEIETHDPVSSINNYFGSLAEINNGKQVRVIFDRYARSLHVSLFDTIKDQEVANFIFPNCN